MKTIFRITGYLIGASSIAASLMLGFRFQAAMPPSAKDTQNVIRNVESSAVWITDSKKSVDSALLNELITTSSLLNKEYQSAARNENIYTAMLFVCGLFLILTLDKTDRT